MIERLEIDGVAWLSVSEAARHSKTKKAEIETLIKAGLPTQLFGGQLLIRLADANRLKRESATMRRANRVTRIVQPSVRPRLRPRQADEPPLPMDSGRRGRGWKGTTYD